ncbi:sugar phosphate isomerase/epimerase family protein [Metabacillus halosaccharovorans]|uniref:sugar phosphate isomerase/epimerase family protein n=1 Tax=Metabacillus halosaccharovorans TaxID=930124 RepID=UPI001C1FDCFD|nr:sugar phosphate isomerase/epimerase family protein [Metabacillus halosaccharovorans]MBU7591271.1 sugar phosphate isomerase/epimerase [Metabacillus halosaccharovorans]
MKLGFNSAILDGCTFEEVIDYASENGFSCVELCAWPRGKAVRKYAGVTHIDVDHLDVDYIKNYTEAKGVKISAIAYYPNALDEDKEKSEYYVDHIKKCIEAAKKLDVNLVNTFIGRNQKKTVQENLAIMATVWKPIVNFAEELDVKIAIENCPMLFTNDEWPGGQNLMTTPAIFRQAFEIIPNKNFGLNYDPSHFVWQQMDYIKPIYEFKERIFHIHFKDIKVYKDRLDDVGIMATPLEYISPKLPGLGDVNWGKYVSALTDIGYFGYAVIEVEDKAFEDSLKSRKDSIKLSKNYLSQYFA